MNKQVLIKPLITEKSELLTEQEGQYTFLVNKKTNKREIKKAVEKFYDIKVKSVNTMIMPGKTKTKNTKSGLQVGGTSSFKKAVVTLEEGLSINFFGDV